MGISGQGASALAKGSGGVWRKTAREDAAVLGGVSRDPDLHWAPLGSGAPDGWDLTHFGPNSPPMGNVGSVKS